MSQPSRDRLLELLRERSFAKREPQRPPEQESTTTARLALPKPAEPAAQPTMQMDASFTYAFQGDEYSHQEAADVDGERTGSYRYVDAEGQEVAVQ